MIRNSANGVEGLSESFPSLVDLKASKADFFFLIWGRKMTP